MNAGADERVATRVTVVVPFYQRVPGILEKALASVHWQDVADDVVVRVIVVDDASPICARDELAAMKFAAGMDVQLIERTNGGPGAARNSALQEIGAQGTDFVAFLDSDDVWAPSHLRDALVALGNGADFYFCDHTRFDMQGSWFENLEGTREWKRPHDGRAQAADADRTALNPGRDKLFDALLREYLSQTSTVVYRWAAHRDTRFDVRQRNAGEDHLFWLDLVKQGNGTVVGLKENVHCGEGVNIYYGAMSWADSKVVDRFAYLLLFVNTVARRFQLQRQQQTYLDGQTLRYARAHGFLFVRTLLRRQLPDLATTGRLLRRDPVRVLLIPYYFLSVLPNRKVESQTW